MRRNLAKIAAVMVLAGAAASGIALAQTGASDSAILAPRLLPFQGVQNFRDVGGYRTSDGRHVKWGLIYRSAELSHLTPADLEALNGLDITTVYDLRSTAERQGQPTAWIGTGAPTVFTRDYQLDTSALNAAFRSGPMTVDRARDGFTNLYLSLLDAQRPQETALFQGLLDDQGATLYHCTAGKDRTGIATALILSALGVPRMTILKDYELSNRYFSGATAAQGGVGGQTGSNLPDMPPEVLAVFLQVDSRYLNAVFDHIESRYGSVEAYLDQALGVSAEDIARLRAKYTE